MAARKKSAKKKAPKGKVLPIKHKKVRKAEDIPALSRAGGKVRKTTHHKFDDGAREKYLEAIGQSGLKMMSAKVAGVTYRAVQNYMAVHPEWKLEVDKAMNVYRDVLLKEAHRRGVKGWVEQPILNKEGEVVGERIKFSDKLLELLVKRVDPISREQVTKVEHSGSAVIASVDIDMKDLLKKLSPEGRLKLRDVMLELKGPDGRDSETPSES